MRCQAWSNARQHVWWGGARREGSSAMKMPVTIFKPASPGSLVCTSDPLDYNTQAETFVDAFRPEGLDSVIHCQSFTFYSSTCCCESNMNHTHSVSIAANPHHSSSLVVNPPHNTSLVFGRLSGASDRQTDWQEAPNLSDNASLMVQ